MRHFVRRGFVSKEKMGLNLFQSVQLDSGQ